MEIKEIVFNEKHINTKVWNKTDYLQGVIVDFKPESPFPVVVYFPEIKSQILFTKTGISNPVKYKKRELHILKNNVINDITLEREFICPFCLDKHQIIYNEGLDIMSDRIIPSYKLITSDKCVLQNIDGNSIDAVEKQINEKRETIIRYLNEL